MPLVSKINFVSVWKLFVWNKTVIYIYQNANSTFCSTGVKNADENELRSIATDPDDIHMYNVADFSFLLDIVDNLTENLCNSVKGPGTYLFA